MLRGVGTDILHVPRISALIARRGSAALASRILHQSEHQLWQRVHAKNDVALETRFLAVR